jgi:hypothetical protein
VRGIVFNVMQDVYEAEFGAAAWDAVLAHGRLDGAYTSLAAYDDAEFAVLVSAAAHVARVSETAVLRLVGRRGFGLLVGRHPQLVEDVSTWSDVLEQLNGVIHPEVEKIYPGAQIPAISVHRSGQALMVTYRSHRELCALAEGLLYGLGDWYRVELEVMHDPCVRHGAEVCMMEIAER